MKIRIQGDSIRLRLTRPEVERVLCGDRVVELTRLPGATLRFELAAGRCARGPIEVALVATRLIVTIDAGLAATWSEPARVGFAHDVLVDDGRRLSVRIEKDFACLDRAEEEPDAYPNPKACAAV